MRPIHYYCILQAILFILSSPIAVAQQDAFLKELAERWETSRQYMITVAEAMPEKDYTFKPTPEEMSFAEQLMHIAWVIDWHAFSKADGQEFKPRIDDFKTVGRSKKEMIGMINREFERAAKLLATFDPARLDETGTYAKFTRTRRQFFMLMADHVTHHRAQMLVYLRLKGIVSPSYIEFQ
ncbi:DinB family protein [Rhodocytophaga rosea]|uniref:DinB family protein n=1 Tax=Rhodocytophaga rosea TaxID=2704465 RepID=A0A6C0GQM7_9BACT|nr:DinB family protein [Rhodocytophaga rosea]QHT70385.1 DinB family protein [Rhodocytophaga rosea]